MKLMSHQVRSNKNNKSNGQAFGKAFPSHIAISFATLILTLRPTPETVSFLCETFIWPHDCENSSLQKYRIFNIPDPIHCVILGILFLNNPFATYNSGRSISEKDAEGGDRCIPDILLESIKVMRDTLNTSLSSPYLLSAYNLASKILCTPAAVQSFDSDACKYAVDEILCSNISIVNKMHRKMHRMRSCIRISQIFACIYVLTVRSPFVVDIISLVGDQH